MNRFPLVASRFFPHLRPALQTGRYNTFWPSNILGRLSSSKPTPPYALQCLLQGESTSFEVEVNEHRTISYLRQAIQPHKSVLREIDSNKIILWKVPDGLATDAEDMFQRLTTISEDDLIAQRYVKVKNAGAKIIDTFGNPIEGMVQIFIESVVPQASLTPFEELYVLRSSTANVSAMLKDSRIEHDVTDLSFLETLNDSEKEKVDKIFVQIGEPPIRTGNNEVKDIQPWLQRLYEFLANIYGLRVIKGNRSDGKQGTKFADHYLTFDELSAHCSATCNTIDFTKNWAFEDKSDWKSVHVNGAINQCYLYSSEFFVKKGMRIGNIYVSIMSDATNYRLWYSFWNETQKGVNAKITTDHSWSKETLYIVASVFKTFKLHASTSPKNFGNRGSNKGATLVPSTEPLDYFNNPKLRTQALYETILEGSTDSPSSLPIIKTLIGYISAIRVLGTGSDSVIFEAHTQNNELAAIKFSLTSKPLKREAEILNKLKKVKYIPRVLHKRFDILPPCIITSMVGRKITSRFYISTACDIITDVLEVLKGLHNYGYIHNDIHPSNIVNIVGKFRLIDFGLTVQRFNKRDTIPTNWPEGNIAFASHNRGKYLGPGDDLESLCYTVAFMYNKNKKYWHTAAQDPCKAIHQKEGKLFYLFDGLPQVFRDFFDHVYDLDVAATPDYKYWQQRFQQASPNSYSLLEMPSISPSHELQQTV